MIFGKLSDGTIISDNDMHTFESKTNKTTLVKNLVTLFLIFIGNINVGFGQYTLVTDHNTLNAGDKFIIVGKKSTDFYAIQDQNTNNRASVLISPPVSNIITTTLAHEFTLEGFSGSWNLKDELNNGYLKPRTGTNNGLQLQASTTNANWTISILPTGVATIVCENTSTYPRNILKFNSTNSPPIFACYASGQADIYIYKKTIIPTCTAPTTQATSATFSTITNNSMNLSWTSGNGDGRIVVMKEASAVSGTPTSGTAYTANAAFGSGSAIATNEFVVYNGTGNSVSVSGLACGKTYHIKVYEYNTTDVCYNTTSPTSASAATLITASPTAPSFTQTCGSTTFAAIPNTATENTFWQTSASGTSETDPADVTKTVSSTNPLYLRTKSSTGCWSNATTVSPAIISSPSITSQPVDQNGTDGGSATFSVVANNATGYQWQISTDNGVNWTNVSGATSASLTVSSLTLSMDGYKYRAIVKATNPCTDVISNVGTLNVTTGPCFSMNGPAFSTSGNTYVGDLDIGGSPTNTIRLASGSGGGSISTTATGVIAGDVTVKFRVKAWSASETQVTVTVDGTSILYTTLPIAFGEVTLNFTSVSANPIITFSTVSDKRLHIGNVQIYCTPTIVTCTPTAAITSFIPTSGPIGTLVTITGTGFTGATAVQFGGINATTFTIVNSTTIVAEVPAGMGANSLITVSDASSCSTSSAGSFAIKSSSGSCSLFPNYTDLFISEIYDSGSLNVWNIELYNPTPNPITLTGVYQIKRAGNISDPANYSRTIDLIGVVPANSVFTISAGSSTQTCGGVSFDFTENGAGINEEDVITLFKNGILVDVSEAPNETGYSLLRNINSGVIAPSSTYIAGDWTVNSAESCSNIGVFTLPSSTIIIDSHPADITGCSLTMSVISPTPGVTYQWKFNNPASMTGWLDVNSTNIPVAIISGETSATLSITGDVFALMDFQFYCEISESGCSLASNAAQFKTDSRPIYRSVATSNGNWSTVSNWEMSTDYTNYVAACTYPRSINSSEVIIQTGTRIVLDLTGANAVDIDHLTIENTGTLELLPNAKLTIYDSIAGADLIVNGTLYDRNSAGNAMDLTNSTWILGANGTVIKSNNGAIAFYRDKYQGGMSNIPATANWIYRYTGDGHPVVGTEDFFYPNLSFENTTASTYSWNNPVNTAFQGSTGFATVKGNFDIGVIGTSTCEVSNVNTHAQPMLLLGNLHIATGSSLLNSAASGTDYGTGYELKGNLFVDGTLNILNGALERVMRFTGTTNQTVSGVGTIDLHKMTVNKPSGDVLLNRNLQAQNELVMIQGNIFTNASMLELGLSTTQKGILTHTNGFVVGKMRRWFNGTNSGNATGLYPMGFEDLVVGAGTGVKNRNTKIEFSDVPADGGHLTVQYIGTPMGPDGIPILAANSGGAGFDVITTEDQGYWKFDNESGKLINAAYTISCTGEGYQIITDLAKLTLLKRVVANGPDWFCPGAHIATSGSITMPTVSRSGVSNWSNFGFGGGAGNPLPVELTAFQVSCEEYQIQIQWSTASELNSSHFDVEKSNDLINWNLISETAAAGNSNKEINYQTSDLERSSKVIYYRLKQVDLNGESKVYGPISTLCEIESNSMVVYPNPSQGEYQVEINWTETSTNAQLQLLDLTGKVIDEMDVNLNTGTTHLQFNQGNLPMGTYLIRLNNKHNIQLTPIRLVIAR